MEVLEKHFRVENFWGEHVLTTFEYHFVGREFTETLLAQELVIRFSKEEWRAILHKLKPLIASQSPVETS